MHNLTLDTPIPSVHKIIELLTYHNSRLGIPMDYDRLLEYYGYYTLRNARLLARIIKYVGSTKSVGDFKDDDFLQFLRSAGVKEGFLQTEKGQISLSSESLEAVVATNLYSEELCKVMQLYSEAKSCKSTISQFATIIDNHVPVPVETWDNHRMILVKPMWVAQNTGRVGTRNPSTLSIARDVGDIYTVPKGWIYFEADSGQIEPRLIQSYILNDPQLKHCTMLYNDAYYGYLHYCTILTDAERRSGTLNIKPIEITDEMKAKRSKFKTFGNATMYGSTENRNNDTDKAAFIKYIGGHPNRIAFQSRIEDQIDRGQRVFNTAFGTPIDITKGPSEQNYSDKTSNAYRAHLIRCAINNPVQGTAADLMRYSVLRANHLIQRKAPNSIIFQYVHDSGKFGIAERDYDNIIDELNEITAYQVEDWIPIYCDPQEGVHGSKLRRFI